MASLHVDQKRLTLDKDNGFRLRFPALHLMSLVTLDKFLHLIDPQQFFFIYEI